MTERGNRVVDRPKHTLYAEYAIWDRLHRIAAFFGYRNHSGRKVGQGNIMSLMTAIALGELSVVDEDGRSSDDVIDAIDDRDEWT